MATTDQPGDSVYIHGAAPSEQERLSCLNQLLNGGSVREVAPRDGERLIDFGAGLGQLTRELARRTGRSDHLGLERSAEQIARARALAAEAGEAELVEFRAGDVLDPPLRAEEWGRFDLAHARFVLEHVPEPLAVVRQMVAAVRPGGRIVLQDDDHDLLRCWPEPPGFAALWHAYVRVADDHGNDAFVGRRLVTLLHRAGAIPRRSTMIFFGGCAGSPELEMMVGNVVELFHGVREQMQARSLIDAADYDAAVASFRAWGQRPDVGFWYAVPWVEGIRP